MIVKTNEGEILWVWAYGEDDTGEMKISCLPRKAWLERETSDDDWCDWISDLRHFTEKDLDYLVSYTDLLPEEGSYAAEQMKRPLWYLHILDGKTAPCHHERLYVFISKYIELEEACGCTADINYAIKLSHMLLNGSRGGEIPDNGLVAWSATDKAA